MSAKITRPGTTLGGAANAFSTLQPDAGTSPTADSSTDTLTLTSSDDSITITGNSATDTIDFVIATPAVADHGGLTGLGDDDHTQYALLAGRAGGQSITGGTAADQDLTLVSTSHATKGEVIVVGRLSSGNGHSNTGTNSTAIGDTNTVSNFYSFATGSGSVASNIAAVSMGSGTAARGAYSSAFGHLADTYGDWSHVKGRRLYGTPGVTGHHLLGDSDPDNPGDLQPLAADSFNARFKNGFNFFMAGTSGPSYLIRQSTVNTTDATVTSVATFATASNKSYLFEARVTARRTGGTAGAAGDSATYVRRCMVKNVAGTVTVSGLTTDFTQEDQAGWDCTIDNSTTTIRIRVTGAADNNITWNSTLKVDAV